ncbi:conserved hypothetical protein [Acidianus hospitalis W1]|uniref:Uncharacterized protein n=1 Tax=Acidianus hospitalis (strain W1) TaxID=933801 RepID=F4B5Z9_ACIHW|nr:hypothetical protein [Acidianus hospitalis]AEE94497.1 conserved hypothetical protein [Acidianus hospitalis W1]
MSEVLNYALQEIQEGKYKIETDEENLELILHPVLLKVFKKDDKYSFVVQNIISVNTDKPRFGPLCSSNTLNSRPAKIRRTEVLKEPKIVLKMDEKIFNIIINVTNISIYPDYRDSFGSPCVMVSTVVLY